MNSPIFNKEYRFLFVGGTCGSFVKTIFAAYLHELDESCNMPTLSVSKTGDCHETRALIRHYHSLEYLDLTKKIVVIDFDEDDVPSIIKMVFHKVLIEQISDDPEFLDHRWGESGRRLFGQYRDNHEMLLQQFLNNSYYLANLKDWKAQINSINPVLTIKFKDIMFGNLNEIITEFFKVSSLPEVDEFIKTYRHANQEYLTYDYPFTVEKLDWNG